MISSVVSLVVRYPHEAIEPPFRLRPLLDDLDVTAS